MAHKHLCVICRHKFSCDRTSIVLAEDCAQSEEDSVCNRCFGKICAEPCRGPRRNQHKRKARVRTNLADDEIFNRV